MTIQQKIKDLESQIEALKSQEIVHSSSNWDKAPVICTLNGVKWLLGPEAEEELTWEDAVAWCKLNGGELPPREILFLASLNQDAADWFREQPYWSSTEFNANYSSTEFSANYAWFQDFSNGYENGNTKYSSYYARAVRKVLI
jgi:hypothetical protein